jgi:hypothetical protein
MVTRPSPVQSIMSPFASPPTDTPVQPGFTPTTPVNESVAAPRRPKTRSAKQRDGFLALGLLIENATGQDYEAVLATWGAYLYHDGDVVSAGSLAQMTAIDESLYAGLGTFPVCPCTPNSDGTVQLTSYGHNGGPVAMQYSPADSIGIAVGSVSHSGSAASASRTCTSSSRRSGPSPTAHPILVGLRVSELGAPRTPTIRTGAAGSHDDHQPRARTSLGLF